MRYILDRLRERSTWLGLTTLLTVVGVTMTPEATEAVTAAGVAIAGLIGVVSKG